MTADSHIDRAKLVEVAREADLQVGDVERVHVGDLAIALIRTGEGFFAVEDRCTHMGGRLSDGLVTGSTVQCPLHFGRFDVRTGEPLSRPCRLPIATYRVKVLDGSVFVDFDK